VRLVPRGAAPALGTAPLPQSTPRSPHRAHASYGYREVQVETTLGVSLVIVYVTMT